MISENDYINLIGSDKDLDDESILALRRQYKSMTKAERKKIDRVYVKEKQRLSTDKWVDLVKENISTGKKIHKQKTKDNIYIYKDGKYIKKSEING